MGIKKTNIQVGDDEVKNLEQAMKGKDPGNGENIITASKKVRENFYVDKVALGKIKKHVLMEKLEGKKISKSSLVNEWILKGVKELNL